MPPKAKTIEDRYQKLTQIEHVLKRPDTYVGSLQLETSQQWVWDEVSERMVYKSISYSPGLFKIFDEILVNAADVKARQAEEKKAVKQKINYIKIDIDQEEGIVRVLNDGDGIPVEIHREHKVYVPELIFGQLLTSDNYDDEEARVTGGRNGYGAKLTNILSKRFTVECGDSSRGRKLSCTWQDNMGKKSDAIITDYSGKDFVKITFKPDFKRFGIETFTDDIMALFKKRVYDIAGTCQINVHLNGKNLGITKFIQYCNLYFPVSARGSSGSKSPASRSPDSDDDSDGYVDPEEKKKKAKKSASSDASKDVFIDPETGFQIVKIHEKVARWEIVIAQSEVGSMQQVSFVNNICTIKGGTHVNYVTDQLITPIMNKLQRNNKGGMTPSKTMALSHVWIFVNCLLVNPVFEGQTKERLKSDAKTFGSVYKVSERVIKSVLTSAIFEAILLWVQTKQTIDINRKMNASTRKSTRILGIPKLEDANDAGTKHGKQCTLIVTEGDSAKTSCVAGLSVVGRDRYGVFPLRGKVLNVRDAKHDILSNNVEIKNLMTILGLKMGQPDMTVDEMRYGRLMIMTDQDPDGSHIKGLLINLIQMFWPGLIKSNKFLCEFVTPLVKCTKGREQVAFFTNTEYREWKRNTDDGRGWKIKYYKGLGTSTDVEFKSYFRNLNRHTCSFKYVDQEDFSEVDKAFNQKLANERKTWIRASNIDTDFIDHSQSYVRYKEFINKDLVHFSRYDVERSIASMVDGFKPGSRKCIFAAIKKKIVKNEIRITQLCGHVLEVAAYHHGEAALQETIIKLAQRFVGANNFAVFEPVGQFGSRKEGGKDCSAPRYINTKLSFGSRSMIPELDEPILDSQMEDGFQIEPKFYVPAIPLVLVNGTEGIGTGWSSFVPQYNPRELMDSCRRWMRGEPLQPIIPYYSGFKGEIRRTEKGYESRGIISIKKEPTQEAPWAIITVHELPVKFWTQQFKDLLDSMLVDNQENDLPSNAIDAGAAKAKARPKTKPKGKAKAKAKGKAKAAIISAVVRNRSKHVTIQDYRDNSTHETIDFEIMMDATNYQTATELGILKEFKLIRPIATTNMVLFDANNQIKKYTDEFEIITDFCVTRHAYYERRKAAIIAKKTRDLEVLSNKANFVRAVCEGHLVVARKAKAALVDELRSNGFKPMPEIERDFQDEMDRIVPGNAKRKAEIIRDDDDEEMTDENDPAMARRVSDYDYLLSMPISSLTQERYEAIMSERSDLDDDLQGIKKKTIAELWEADLVTLEEAFVWQENQDEKQKAESMKHKPRRTSIEVSKAHQKKLLATPVKGLKLPSGSGIKAGKGAAPTPGKAKVASKKKAKKVDDSSDEEDSFMCGEDSLDFGPSADSIDDASPVRASMKPKKKAPSVKSEPTSPRSSNPSSAASSVKRERKAPVKKTPVKAEPTVQTLSLAERLAQMRAETTLSSPIRHDDLLADLKKDGLLEDSSSPKAGSTGGLVDDSFDWGESDDYPTPAARAKKRAAESSPATQMPAPKKQKQSSATTSPKSKPTKKNLFDRSDEEDSFLGAESEDEFKNDTEESVLSYSASD